MNPLELPAVLVTARTFAGLVFVWSAVGKFRHWLEFQGVVANYRLLPDFLVPTTAYVLPFIEAGSGALLLAGLGTRVSAAAAIGLLLGFALAMAVNILRGRAHIDCGCFEGPLRQPLGWMLVLRNVVLAMLLGTAILSAAGPAGPGDRLGGALAGAVLYGALWNPDGLRSIARAWRARRARHRARLATAGDVQNGARRV